MSQVADLDAVARDMEFNPCPFCGGKPKAGYEGGKFYVYCTDCLTIMEHDYVEDLQSQWNAPTEKIKELEALIENLKMGWQA